jgi:hypothetical protein
MWNVVQSKGEGRLLEHWMPYGLVAADNMIFELEWRRLRTLRTEASVQKYNRWVTIGCIAVVILWWPIRLSSSVIIEILPYFASFVLMLLSSFYTVLTVIGPLHQQVTTQQWDLLRMTPQHEEKILMAQDAVAQLRVWRVAALEVALRAASIAVPFVALTLDLFRYPYGFEPLFGAFCCFTIFIIVAAVLYTLEPILRMRALVALSLYIGLRVQHLSAALLAGFAAALFFHLLQIVAVGLLIAFLPWGGGSSAGYGYGWICIVPIGMALLVGVLLYLWEVRAWALRLTLRHAFTAR